jgi:hypothetical protein
LEYQFVLAGNHLVGTEQRHIGSAVQIRNRRSYQFSGVAVQLPKLDRDARPGSPDGEIEYVRGKCSFHRTRSPSRNLAILEISAKVRVLKKLRENGIDTSKELEVKVILEGAFDTAYSAGDNREIVATDTMKNTVNVFAYEKLGVETEPFVVELAAHFLDKYPQVSGVEIETEERVWERITKDGSPSPTKTHFFCRPMRPKAGLKAPSREANDK